jgi:hypothetical protein
MPTSTLILFTAGDISDFFSYFTIFWTAFNPIVIPIIVIGVVLIAIGVLMWAIKKH